jgi:hypothetical protein
LIHTDVVSGPAEDNIYSVHIRGKIMNKLLTLGCIASITLLSNTASAGNSVQDKHYFKVGAFSQTADIQIKSTNEGFPPIEIDLVDDLGMDDSSVAINAMYRWRFTNRWSLSFTYQLLDLDGNGAASKDFNFEGTDYTAGVLINSEYKMKTYLADIGYSIIRNEKWELIVGAGLHSFDIETSISGLAIITDGNSNLVEETTRASTDVLAPLPNLRIGLVHLFTPKWEVGASGGWLSLEIDNIDGQYTYLDLNTEYRFTDRFGIGASYQFAEIDITSTKDANNVDKLNLQFEGPSLYFTYGF